MTLRITSCIGGKRIRFCVLKVHLYLWARVLRWMLCERGVWCRTHTGAWHFELLFIVGLIRQQHTNFSPAIEEECYRPCPYHQHQYNYTNLDTSYLKTKKKHHFKKTFRCKKFLISVFISERSFLLFHHTKILITNFLRRKNCKENTNFISLKK